MIASDRALSPETPSLGIRVPLLGNSLVHHASDPAGPSEVIGTWDRTTQMFRTWATAELGRPRFNRQTIQSDETGEQS